MSSPTSTIPGARLPHVAIERRVVEEERPVEREPDRAGRELAAHLDHVEPEDAAGQERLAQAPEEDLHPRLHEDALGSLAHPMQLHEAVEERDERLGRGGVDRERPGLGLELLRLAPDLVAQLGRERLEVAVPRIGERQERGDAVLVLGLLHAEPLGGRRVAQQAQPGRSSGRPAQVGVGQSSRASSAAHSSFAIVSCASGSPTGPM